MICKGTIAGVAWILLCAVSLFTVRAGEPPAAQTPPAPTAAPTAGSSATASAGPAPSDAIPDRSPGLFAPERPPLGERDSLERQREERNDRLYDSIRTKSGRHAVSRALYRALFRRQRDTTRQGRVIDENSVYAPYAGRTIGAIRIERKAPFDADGSWLERTANKLHTLTRPDIIRRDLLFRTGDRLDPQIVVRNLQLLQSRSYISDAAVEVLPDPLDTTRVDLVVRTRDSWTIDIDAGLHSAGETSVGLSEANLFGRGHLRIETNFNYRGFDYGGNVVEYGIPNIFGSFYDFDFAAGRSFNTSRFDVGLRKEFLKPTDYEFGATYRNDKVKHYFVDRDTTELVKSRDYDLWAGYARYVPQWRVSNYLAARYNRRDVTLRPGDVTAAHHPALHDYNALLFGLGLYRERIYSANMIYGYGRREYLSAGFKGEIVAGYVGSEYADELYLGFAYKTGGFTPIGYLMGSLTSGSYVDTHANDWRRGAVDLQGIWFSNLFRTGRSHLRQFVKLRYTAGWSRFTGADESIRFAGEAMLRALNEKVTGTNRLLLNTETVLFTPYQPLGFRIAVFGFWDAGLIGYHSNIFRNAGFTSVGVGLRMRNERLVFKAIQIQLGVAFGHHGLAESRYFRFSSESALEQYRYRPGPPERLVFE